MELLQLDLCRSEFDTNGDRPLMDVEIEGLKGKVMVDTGARCSIAGERLFQHLKTSRLSATKTVVTISFANGEPRKVDAHAFEKHSDQIHRYATIYSFEITSRSRFY